MLEVGIFVLFLIKSLVQNQHGWFLTQGYPKGIQRCFCDWFRYANVSLAHFALTEIDFSAATRTHCPIWKRHSSLLPKGSCVVQSLTHPRERILGTTLSRSRSLRKHQHSLSISNSSLGRVYALQHRDPRSSLTEKLRKRNRVERSRVSRQRSPW